MRIKQIEVTGLFGMFDHVIPLNMEDRITIIYGLNGVGKTATIKLLNSLFNFDFSELEAIPFKTFKIEFDDYEFIQLSKLGTQYTHKNSTIDKQEIKVYFSGENSDIFLSDVKKILRPEVEENDILNTLDYMELLINRIKENKLVEIPNWIDNIFKSFNIRLIESQRLLNIPKFSQSIKNAQQKSMMLMRLSVEIYAKELANYIQDKLAEYAQLSQSLDRTFPVRVIQQQVIAKMSDENLRTKLSEIEAKRYKLINVGLLDKDENPDFQIPEKIDETTNKFLSVYVEDVEKKLSVFDDLAERIEIFKRIINQRFSYKQINIDKDAGFTFTCNGSPLSPEKLSSGEQHELIILYELLFKVPPNSLILIDEPEISLHVEWQVHFLKDLQEITRISDIDVVIATHSPDIIHDRWDLTVELKGSRNERNTNTESYC